MKMTKMTKKTTMIKRKGNKKKMKMKTRIRIRTSKMMTKKENKSNKKLMKINSSSNNIRRVLMLSMTMKKKKGRMKMSPWKAPRFTMKKKEERMKMGASINECNKVYKGLFRGKKKWIEQKQSVINCFLKYIETLNFY